MKIWLTYTSSFPLSFVKIGEIFNFPFNKLAWTSDILGKIYYRDTPLNSEKY